MIHADPSMLSDPDRLRNWATEQCTPFVRELTFANAEEITEMRRPLLILFYNPQHREVVKLFTELVERDFKDIRSEWGHSCYTVGHQSYLLT